jgi:GNAT superfamily N-acetyltransferase
MTLPKVTVRPASSTDVETIVELIRGLAAYEELADECAAEAEPLRRHLFGPNPAAEVLLAEIDESVAGFALFFPTYSTFLVRPGLWLEDLFVTPEHRGRGVGRALLTRVAQLATERACGRLEWSVLDWNRPAIAFYRGIGARLMNDWTTCRIDGPSLTDLARAEQPPG